MSLRAAIDAKRALKSQDSSESLPLSGQQGRAGTTPQQQKEKAT